MSSLLKLHLPSKTTIAKLRSCVTFNSSFCSSSPPNPLTPSQLTKINHLISTLINTNQLSTALHLIKTTLSTNPSLISLNLTPLINTLTSHHDLNHTFSLLTHLLHTPHSHSLISPISFMLLYSYLQNSNTIHAFKLFKWLQRPDSSSPPNNAMFRLVITALCRDGFVLHAVGVFRDMVGGTHMEFKDCLDCGKCFYRGLLSEARVDQGVELNTALLILARDSQVKGRGLHVLDRIIVDWTE